MKKILLLSFSIFLIFAFSCRQDGFILNENFNSNKIGWSEEITQSHRVEIKDGFLYIYSIDTSKQQTSCGPQNTSFLWDLPKKYEIEAFIKDLGYCNSVHYGIILRSATLEYKFSFSDSGEAEVKEWDYNRGFNNSFFTPAFYENIKSYDVGKDFKIIIENRKFSYFINDSLMGEGILKSKSWQDIRFFTTTGSKIKVDYLRIIK